MLLQGLLKLIVLPCFVLPCASVRPLDVQAPYGDVRPPHGDVRPEPRNDASEEDRLAAKQHTSAEAVHEPYASSRFSRYQKYFQGYERPFVDKEARLKVAASVLVPLLGGMLLILITRCLSQNDSRRTKTERFAFALFLVVASSFAYGYAVGSTFNFSADTKEFGIETMEHIVLVVGGVAFGLCMIVAFLSSNIVFGWPDFPKGLRVLGVLFGCCCCVFKWEVYWKVHDMRNQQENPFAHVPFKENDTVYALSYANGAWYSAKIVAIDLENDKYKVKFADCSAAMGKLKSANDLRPRDHEWLDDHPEIQYHIGGEWTTFLRENISIWWLFFATFTRSWAFAPSIFYAYGSWLLRFGAFADPSYHARRIGRLIISLAIGSRYMRDQLIIVGLGMVVNFAIDMGFRSAFHPYGIPPAWLTMYVLIGSYSVTVFARRRRKLPAALCKCGFVRLGYLRKMVAEGIPIERNQDLPSDAFGDPAKASELIVTSHRWLNRFSCDVPTSDNPLGVRLETMAKRIDAFYPEHFSLSAGFWPLFRSLRFSGWDVLVFFDFMAIPQIGKTDDGVEIPRTTEELQVFQEALPEMGALYSMYPVLVLPEVTGDAHPYFDSGWCYCEWQQALLMRRLSKYSQAFLDSLPSSSSATSSFTASDDDGRVAEFEGTKYLQELEGQLAAKKFYFDADRDIVRDIVKSKLILRELADAILYQDLSSCQKFLEQLKAENLTHFVNSAVDDNLNTLLHIAIRLPCEKIQDFLLGTPGIEVNVRNLRGDTPWQWFMFPVSVVKISSCCYPALSRPSKSSGDGGTLQAPTCSTGSTGLDD